MILLLGGGNCKFLPVYPRREGLDSKFFRGWLCVAGGKVWFGFFVGVLGVVLFGGGGLWCFLFGGGFLFFFSFCISKCM